MAGRSEPIARTLLCAALLLAAGATPAAAEPVYGRSSELGIDFELAGDSKWCEQTVVVQLGAPQASAYQPESAPFLQMIGRIRAVIHGQCNKVERILFIGFAREQRVFAAEMTRLTRWRRLISLDPETESPSCASASQDDNECDKRAAAYAIATQVMTGPGFADVELTSVLEDRTDLHAAWQAKGVFGALKLSHSSEYDDRYATSTDFAEANVKGLVEACGEDGGRTSPMPGRDFGAIALRSVVCRRPGKPPEVNIVVVKSQDDWFYLFSLSGEERHTAAANAFANRLAQTLAAR
jgi:hypothetical protein